MEQQLSQGIRRYVEKANELGARRKEYRAQVRSLKFDTIAVHGVYGARRRSGAGRPHRADLPFHLPGSATPMSSRRRSAT